MELNAENKKGVMNKEGEVNKVSHFAGKRFDDKSKRCKFCTQSHRMNKSLYPTWGKTCYSCHKPDHFPGSDVCEGKSEGTPGKRSEFKSKGKGNDKYHKKGGYPKKKVHVVCDGESSDKSIEGTINVVSAPVSALTDPKTKPLFCKMA